MMKSFKNKLFKEFSGWMKKNSISKLQFFIHSESFNLEDLYLDNERYDNFYNDSYQEISSKFSDLVEEMEKWDNVDDGHLKIVKNLSNIYNEKSRENKYSTFFDEYNDSTLYEKYFKYVGKFPWKYIDNVFVTINSDGIVNFADQDGDEI